MIINSYCDINYDKDFLFSSEEVESLSVQFLEYLFNHNLLENFSSDNNYELEIMVCDNDFIHNVNRDYRKKDAPTDVITFALYFDSEEKIVLDNTISLGQIIISYDKVISQAEENNVTKEYEFKNLLAHGILHLLGFDHLDENSLNYMLDLQNKMIEGAENVKV